MVHEMLGLRQIPESKWKDFSARVKAAKGQAILLVHPFYHDIGTDSTYQRTVTKLLKQDKLPVVILQGRSKWATNQGKYPDHALVIPTYPESSPVLLEKLEKSADEKYDELHKELAEKLSNAGVKTVHLGGMYSDAGRISGRENDELSQLIAESEKKLGHSTEKFQIRFGCLGITYANLIKTGKIPKIQLIAPALYPRRPEYYRSTKQFP